MRCGGARGLARAALQSHSSLRRSACLLPDLRTDYEGLICSVLDLPLLQHPSQHSVHSLSFAPIAAWRFPSLTRCSTGMGIAGFLNVGAEARQWR